MPKILPLPSASTGRSQVRRVRRGPSKRRANTPRNSECSYPFDWLDWTAWWTDGTAGSLYLHVRGYEPDLAAHQGL